MEELSLVAKALNDFYHINGVTEKVFIFKNIHNFHEPPQQLIILNSDSNKLRQVLRQISKKCFTDINKEYNKLCFSNFCIRRCQKPEAKYYFKEVQREALVRMSIKIIFIVLSVFLFLSILYPKNRTMLFSCLLVVGSVNKYMTASSNKMHLKGMSLLKTLSRQMP